MKRLALLLLVGFIAGNVQADSSITVTEEESKPSPKIEVTETKNFGSDASFDKRLPPTYPGERINDSGKDIRVWSTSGPVPVSDAPEPWKEKEQIPTGVGVVVDQRK